MHDENISSQFTGDPFIDLGSFVLKTLRKRFDSKSDLEIIDYVIGVYLKNWNQKLHSIFHTNSKILHPGAKGRHREDTLTYYKSIIENERLDGCLDDGYCKTCGKKGLLYPNSRNFFPLSGSGAFVNFHHAHEAGIYLCNECTLKLFFVPLGVILVGGKNGFLHAQSEKVRHFWQKRVIIENLDKIAKNASEGILRTDYSNPENALFYLAAEIIQEVSDDNFSEYLQLYNFTNFGATPDCAIYVLPNPVFNFLNKVIRYYRNPWHKFVNRYYRIKDTKWDFKQLQWFREKKKQVEVLEEKDYLNNPNEIYQKLLADRSILHQLFVTFKNHFNYKLEKFPIEIVHHYVMEVLNMTKEQIGAIARIADVIFELSRKENNYKKYLFMLESAGKAFQLRGALLKIVKANFQSGAKEPLIRMEDYVNYLFPDGQYWGEVRDLLLIHLYEKLHDEGVNREAIPDEEVVEAIENEPVNQF
ncbi:MAG: type I-B CRISPR-associated protein Cas8b1/Cst1 [candidate division KSB1 bacterium]|nr:type I-B CRISPR-associated protein Cas8b1/Cst1 [candidate division KSB1 bacterium]